MRSQTVFEKYRFCKNTDFWHDEFSISITKLIRRCRSCELQCISMCSAMQTNVILEELGVGANSGDTLLLLSHNDFQKSCLCSGFMVILFTNMIMPLIVSLPTRHMFLYMRGYDAYLNHTVRVQPVL